MEDRRHNLENMACHIDSHYHSRQVRKAGVLEAMSARVPRFSYYTQASNW